MDKMSESSFTALYGNLIDVSEILKSRKVQLDLPTLKLPAMESLTNVSFITKRIKENMPTLTSQFQIQDAIMTPAIKEALQGYSEIFKGVDFDINELLNQAETTIQQASEPVLTTADSVEIKSTLRDFEETLDRVSPQLPSDTVDAVKSSVVKPLKDKACLSRSDAIALIGVLLTFVLWVLSQILPDTQLQEVVDGNRQISEQLQQSNELNEQSNELNEQFVESVQVLCDEVDVLSNKLDVLSNKLDVLIEQNQGAVNSPNPPKDTANGECLNKTTDAQN